MHSWTRRTVFLHFSKALAPPLRFFKLLTSLNHLFVFILFHICHLAELDGALPSLCAELGVRDEWWRARLGQGLLAALQQAAPQAPGGKNYKVMTPGDVLPFELQLNEMVCSRMFECQNVIKFMLSENNCWNPCQEPFFWRMAIWIQWLFLRKSPRVSRPRWEQISCFKVSSFWVFKGF